MQTIPIPSNGYFYTYLTNYSDNLVSFDNLTIRRKNGVVRAVKEYYPYGLEYGRFNGSYAYNAIEMYNKGYSSATWHELEWKYEGLDLNYFAARYYDPIIGRWHAPDPLEQCHSPYTGMVNDPANFVDPDGRLATPLITLASSGSFYLSTANSLVSTGMSIMGGVMSFASTCAGIVAGVRGFITTADLVKGGFDFEKVTGLNGGDYFSNKVSNSTENNEVSWKRVTRNDGSFMGNYIPMDGTSGKQNGNNVDQFLYYSMHKLQKDNNVEITALLLQAEGSTDCSYLIMDWVTTEATADSGNMLPEVVPSNGKKAPYIMLNGVKHNVYAFLHTHPDKPAGTPDKGAPSNFDNAPSFYDAFFSCDWGGIPNYVLGVDFISRVSCKDAGGVELNTRPKDANNNPIDFVSDYYKIAEVYELNTGKFSFVRDVFPKFKRPIKGAK